MNAIDAMATTNYDEQALVFALAGETLLALVAQPDPDAARDCGVLVIVGGPQYRVGSHRQFLLLSRRLAAAGYPVLRFDYRGMGDSGGAPRDFTAVDADIGAAIDAFFGACPGLRRVVLWGLCDAASAALLYVGERRDARIAGLSLLNPWVRSEVGLAQAQIKHYYGQRLLERAFWAKLLSGRMQLVKSLRDFVATAIAARGAKAAAAEGGDQGAQVEKGTSLAYQDGMARGWRGFAGPLLLILSGDDLVAKEFIDFSATNARWSGLLESPLLTRVDLAEADHTFSAAAHSRRVEEATLRWLATL